MKEQIDPNKAQAEKEEAEANAAKLRKFADMEKQQARLQSEHDILRAQVAQLQQEARARAAADAEDAEALEQAQAREKTEAVEKAEETAADRANAASSLTTPNPMYVRSRRKSI